MRESKILDEYGDKMRVPVRVQEPQWMRARFDSAQTTNDNKNHWAYSDGSSPNAAVAPHIRRLLRNRSRYEVANNSFLFGMVSSKVNFTIGRGPRLQMLREGQREGDKQIETAWRRHCRVTRFCQKLRTAYRAKLVDGEGIAIAVNNSSLRGRTPVQLDLRLYETDQLSDEIYDYELADNRIDGILLDSNGDPEAYHILHEHPGTDRGIYTGRGRWIPARVQMTSRGISRREKQVFHLYREDRPGQRRGIPYTTPCLPLFAIMRRYTLAALHSSEWAAESNAIMKSAGGMAADEPDEVEALLSIPWARNSLLTLPWGWEMQQLKAEQPTTTFAEFYRQVLNEAARCLDVPFNVASGNSSEYNMASGRLDQRIFYKPIEIERADLEDELIEPFFESWLREYLAEQSGMSLFDIDIEEYPHIWGYDGFDEDDPLKVAKADTELWGKGLLSDEDYWLRKNLDPEEMYRKLERQSQRRQEIGLPMPGVTQQQVVGDSSDDAEESDEPAGQFEESAA